MTQTEYQILMILRQHLSEDKIREVLRQLRREVTGNGVVEAIIKRLCFVANT